MVNLQVVFPGGWGQLKQEQAGLHFLWENLLFSPATNLEDPDEWLWENTLDFWSVTSFESVRLNFTLRQDQVKKFVPKLEALIKPRPVSTDFLNQEIKELQQFWQTDRDRKEDTVLRALFKNENVVHPDENLIDQLETADLEGVINIWADSKPFVIILGTVETDDLIALSHIFPEKNTFKTLTQYKSPKNGKHFFTPTRWGLALELNQSHIFELLIIELWEQLFKVQFYFEYHLNDLFVWTNDVEHPRLLAQKIKGYTLTEKDFNSALSDYLKFLDQIYKGENSTHLEKLAELTEGLHAHPFQSGTYGVNQKQLDLSKTFKEIKYQAFKDFYDNFIKVVPDLK
ncbi:hypothetical protein GW797_05630 [Candidatus Parcubacteria bacterium]|nr:hypothetical protein [Candidatus Parcubacteria bacterium]